MTIASGQPKGLEMVLRVLRVRPDDAHIFVCAQFGYYDDAKVNSRREKLLWLISTHITARLFT